MYEKLHIQGFQKTGFGETKNCFSLPRLPGWHNVTRPKGKAHICILQFYQHNFLDCE